MAGFSNITGDESIMFADNCSFNGTERGGKMTTNGQLWIGSTASPHVRLGNITSPDGSLLITNGAGTIQLTAAGGAAVVTKLSDDVNTVTSPSAGIIQLPGHVVRQGATKFSTTVSGSSLININPMSASRHIVDSLGFNGTSTTIAAAITAATSGDTIFVMPGTYTENLALKVGVNIAAYSGDGDQPTVTIVGKATISTAGTVTISNIRLQTNTDYFLQVTGSAATILNLENCYLNALDANGINFTTTNASSEINVNKSTINVNTSNTSHIMTSTGTLYYTYCERDGVASTVASSNSAGLVWAKFSEFSFPLSTATTGSLLFNHIKIAILATVLTHNGTGVDAIIQNSHLDSGNNTTVVVGAGAVAQIYDTTLRNGSGNSTTGLGTIQYSGLSFTTTAGSLANTTQTARPFYPGNVVMQPAGTGGTATSNTMTTYEEGTFTPTLLGSGTAGTPTYVVQQGYYTKIGNMVKCWVQLQISAHTGAGDATFGGFPFTIKNQTNYSPVGVMLLSSATWVWPGTKTQVSLFGTINTTNAVCSGSVSGAVLANTQIQNAAATFRYELCYQV